MRPFSLPFLLLLLLLSTGIGAGAAPKTRNVFLITTDGLRWEEVFRGAEEVLISKEFGNVSDTNALRARFWRPTAEERRLALFPFLWGTLAKHGQLFGNRDRRSDVRVSNTHHFSYPGYSELLTGVADPTIDSNDKILNSNTNVFEWLHLQDEFRGRVAATVNWDVLPWILNAPRAGFLVWSGFEVPAGTRRIEVNPLLSELVDHGRTIWSGVLLDTFVRAAAKHTVTTLRPRALYVSVGETDDWAHEGRYERYLKAAHEFDKLLAALWQLAQSLPRYRDSTTFVITTDHGRGPSPIAWQNHGRQITESAYLWLAVLGPDTPALGERDNVPLVTQAQTAATVAGVLGKDFRAFSPKAAPPVTDVLPKRR